MVSAIYVALFSENSSADLTKQDQNRMIVMIREPQIEAFKGVLTNAGDYYCKQFS